NVGLDHQDILGSDLRAILEEKMQILKPGVPAWTAIDDGDLLQILKFHAVAVGCSLTNVKDAFTDAGDRGLYSDGVLIESPLEGRHQIKNLAVALGLCRSLQKKYPIDFRKT